MIAKMKQLKMKPPRGVSATRGGSLSELIKVAMNNIYKTMIEKKLKGKMILQIHDELLFEIPISEKDVFLKLIKNQMENAIQFNVPIKVDANYGKNWYEAH